MDRRKLLLAYGIAEYHTVHTALQALHKAGVPVPFTVMGRIQSEADGLQWQWAHAYGNGQLPADRTALVEEARTYCTEHMADIELLNDEEETG